VSDELVASDSPRAMLLPQLHELQQEVLQLRRALRSRDLIGQAKGMVRLTAGCDEETAWLVLVRMSQTTNRKLSELAAELADDLPVGRLDADLDSALRSAIELHRPAAGGGPAG